MICLDTRLAPTALRGKKTHSQPRREYQQGTDAHDREDEMPSARARELGYGLHPIESPAAPAVELATVAGESPGIAPEETAETGRAGDRPR
jgi:hypothetical protein